jgi:hypothetical protein
MGIKNLLKNITESEIKSCSVADFKGMSVAIDASSKSGVGCVFKFENNPPHYHRLAGKRPIFFGRRDDGS